MKIGAKDIENMLIIENYVERKKKLRKKNPYIYIYENK
jgi:hypothetical protein